MRKALILLVCSTFGIFLFSSATPPAMVEQVFAIMEGDYSSAAQAAADTDYFDIRLHMHRIWPERKDGYWMYVEQAMGARQDKPYRQRVYRVYAPTSKVKEVISEVYTFRHAPLRFTGAHNKPELLKGITQDSLELREGCHITLTPQGKGFAGATGKTSCPSDLRGASYATSVVRITPDTLISWDQGWNKEGMQVWGATKGGYRFVKEKK